MAKDDVDKCSKAYRESAAFKRASFHPPDEIWAMFVEAEGFNDVICTFKALVDSLTIDHDLHGLEFYQVLKSKLTSWRCQSLWDLLNSRLKCTEYRHENISVAKNIKCIVVGAGPIGLRTAIEMLMLGCEAVVVEKRKDFSRNNVLHLWPFLLHDFRTLGAKKFYGKFGAGCIDHINIKTLQTILLKVALVLGVEVYPGVEFKEIVEPTDDHGWRARVDPPNHENISKYDFDVVIGADGKKNVLPGFTQVELRGSLAIGITCNYINSNTPEETSCKEISGISYQFKPAFFEELKSKHGVELENIVYYKDETHYFVMTARKPSLIEQGVILKDFSDPVLLVQTSNINKSKLLEYACNAVRFSTTLPKLEYKKLSNGEPDIALFDFTSLKKAENASRIIERKKHKLLLALVGDSLIEPFWPTGSGCGRGVLSALDVAWMVRQFALKYPPLAMIRERENVFKLLSASTNDTLQKNYSLYTIDPKTRYSALDTKKITNLDSLKSLYDTDDLSADFTISSPSLQTKLYGNRKRTAVERRKSSGGGASRPSGRTVAGKTKRKLERQESKNKSEEKKLSIKDATNFFEEHSKKMGMGAEVQKPKRMTLTSDEFSGLEGIDEDINESDDDVMVANEPALKKKNGEEKNTAALKRQTSKENVETPRSKSVKRQPSKDTVKRQTSKSLKRQSSKDDGESSGTYVVNEDVPSSKKKVFHAKGGGLKSKMKSESRKSTERSDSSKPRRKSSEKKSTSVKKKSRKSVGSASEMEASREEPIQPVDAKTFFSKWLEALLPRLFTKEDNNSTPPGTYEHPLDVCIQTSVMSIMAVSLLYDCNKPPRRRASELKLKEIIANANTKNDISGKASSSFDKHDATEELSFIRAGRVRDSMAKWQKLVESEEQKHDYYDFIKKGTKDSVALDTEKKDGILLIKHENADFTPKDVIDVEEQLIADEEEERKRSRLAKMTTGTTSNGDIELQLALEQFCDQQSPVNAILMLQVLYNIHKRILDEPSVDKHYRIYTKGKMFHNYVWRWEGAKDYFIYIGWIMCGDFLVLSKSQPVHLILKVIEDVFRKNKKVELLYSGSLKSQSELANERKLHSVSVDSNLNEDEFTNIDAPPERDSAIGSGMDDDDDLDIKSIGHEHEILKRLQSKEHSLGDEAYIVVDFVNETKSTSEQPTQMDTVETSSENIQTPSHNEIKIGSESPFTAVQVDKNFTFEPSIAEENDDVELDEPKLHKGSSYVDISRTDVIDTPMPSVEEKHVGNDIETMESEVVVSEVVVPVGDVVSNSVQVENKIELNGCKKEVTDEMDVDITDVAITLEKHDSLKIEELEEKKPLTPTGKRKVFSAGRGLKKAKEDRLISDKIKDEKLSTPKTPKTDTPNENTSPTLQKDITTSPLRTQPKKTSCTDIVTNTTDLRRASSSKSVHQESSPSSIVKQNKLLFDQQIANELKVKYVTPQDKAIPRFGSSGKGGVNGIERDTQERKGSLKSNYSYVDSCDLDLTGIVSGARSLFEGKEKAPNSEIKKSTSNTTIKEADNIQKKDVGKTEAIKQASVSTESVIVNTVPVPVLSSTPAQRNIKKKKFPFKKKAKSDKKQGSNQTVELIGAKLIADNQPYEERAIDVEAITPVIESNENERSASFTTTNKDDNINNEQKQTTLNSNELVEKTEVESTPVISTNTPLPVTDNVEKTFDDKVTRRNSKKRRLCKTRVPDVLNNTELISNPQETMELDSNTIVQHSNNESNNDIDNTYVRGTIVSLLPDDEEEILTETLLSDVPMDTCLFGQLEKLQEGEEQPLTNINTEECADPHRPTIEALKVDIDSLQNESSIDEDLTDNDISELVRPVICKLTDGVESIKTNTELRVDDDIGVGDTNICITVSEPCDDDLNSITDDMSDATGSFYDGDNASMNLSMENDMVDEKKKKKKKFPFKLKIGKKNKDKTKSESGSPDNVFDEDASSESSYKITKKKKKSKSIDNLNEIGQSTSSTGSVNTFPKTSSSSSLPKSPHLDQQGKSKSKKLPFFKRKRSGSNVSLDNNQLDPNGKLNGVSGSTPGTPKHLHTNGHSNGHTTNQTNGHQTVIRENLI